MHPYPLVQDTDSFVKPFLWPQAGAANLDRVKQALWDAFHGTGQPVVAEHPGSRTDRFAAPQALPIDLDEGGEQTTISGHEAAYDGTTENVIPISEAQQAANHVVLAEIAACDPTVKALLFFQLIDNTGVSTGFQSGNLYADLTPKQSYADVKTKMAAAQGLCQGGLTGIRESWAHTDKVLGAAGSFGGPMRHWAFSVTATEDATYRATLSSVTATGGSPRAVLRAAGKVKANLTPLVRFNGKALHAGHYEYTVTLAAATDSQRTTTLVSRRFLVRS
jgi:hypothetical protein